MAQSRVTEFFATKKGSNKGQAAKRRKLNVQEINVQSSEIVQETNTRTTRSRQQVKLALQAVDNRPENQNVPQKDSAISIKGIVDIVPRKAEKTNSKARARKGKTKSTVVEKNQPSLQNFMSTAIAKGEITEETTSSCDDHDTPLSYPLTPSKQSVCENQSNGVSRKRTLRGNVKLTEDASPAKAKCVLEQPNEPAQTQNEETEVDKIGNKSKTKAKRRLALKIPLEVCVSFDNIQKYSLHTCDRSSTFILTICECDIHAISK